MIEEVIRFGRSLHLSGILTEPEAGDQSLPTLVIVNSGRTHHVGPYRLYVDLSRALAERGIRTMRFDVTNTGDSQCAIAAEKNEINDGYDIQDALDYLSRDASAAGYVLFGQFSAADQAVAAAMRDRRVIGAILVEPSGYRTFGYHLRRSLRWPSPASLLRPIFTRKRKSTWQRTHLSSPESQRPVPHERDAMQRQIQELIERDVRLLYVYAGQGSEGGLYRASQFWRMFPKLPRIGAITVSHFPRSDDAFSNRADRSQLISLCEHWVLESAISGRLPVSRPSA
jgi:hypothetical protein